MWTCVQVFSRCSCLVPDSDCESAVSRCLLPRTKGRSALKCVSSYDTREGPRAAISPASFSSSSVARRAYLYQDTVGLLTSCQGIRVVLNDSRAAVRLSDRSLPERALLEVVNEFAIQCAVYVFQVPCLRQLTREPTCCVVMPYS
jgi:hypothetical protein